MTGAEVGKTKPAGAGRTQQPDGSPGFGDDPGDIFARSLGPLTAFLGDRGRFPNQVGFGATHRTALATILSGIDCL